MAAGRRLQRAGLLSVPEERQPPRTLLRGAHKRGFDDLMPPAARSLPRAATRRRGPTVLALASVALVALVLLPRTALSPELPPGLLAFVPALRGSPPPSLRSRCRWSVASYAAAAAQPGPTGRPAPSTTRCGAAPTRRWRSGSSTENS